MSDDDYYGPPPAYSVDPPPSVYIIPNVRIQYQERPSSLIPSGFSSNFLLYLLGTGILHIFIGIAAIVCDILLINVHESYSFCGFWAGLLYIILGIYLILFMSTPKKQTCSLQRFKFIHTVAYVITIVSLILSSLNLATDFCSESYYEPYQCEHSAKKLKIMLVAIFSLTFVQISITAIVTFLYTR